MVFAWRECGLVFGSLASKRPAQSSLGTYSVRIISGNLRGRQLSVPKGRGVRPTSDQVKESLFSIIASNIVQTSVLDLFAGTGNLGIEALSRDAAHAVFVEKVPAHFQALQSNLAKCSLEEKSDAYCGDANTLLRVLQRRYKHFDLIFLDPPYRHTKMLSDVLIQIASRKLLAQHGRLIIEHAQIFSPPERIKDALVLDNSRRFGDTSLSFYLADNA
ncbi:16S rRNA (guanine(966)-N(2))-methyltransferase RsmD [candidate division KSB3 bacterium]|uniref:16S rRNA (Guanine(966)-N(2))-methyltransferase RsmD n=1 Tax=candidate division KSB3 bacterium TaxID=2044937 RepID=A0A2G6E0M6_9BACT|nr:MAG: 16S rRNA (guanine(966)-N(2))-methyltransferase RsmD [candidate division KSB3 bacterium]PIE28331.1 MAG: 16S rRNA (guanine(966)-N(2))-methyltransferase RsmD [candidate division KSB3 bacterium]